MRFSELNYQKYKNTRNTIQSYSQLLSDIKKTFTAHQKNWEEFSLNAYAKGFTTGPIPISINENLEALDLNINMQEHKLKIFFGKERPSVDLENQSVFSFAKEVEEKLNSIGIGYKVPIDKFKQDENAEYNQGKAGKIWSAFRHIYFALQKFKGTLLEETSSINIWPHHFDIAMLVFSGRIIPGKDVADWDNSREQMNFGFSTGDDTIAEPYFYITAYPFNENLLKTELPSGAYWNKKGWAGAVLKYENLQKSTEPIEELFNFFKTVKEKTF